MSKILVSCPYCQSPNQIDQSTRLSDSYICLTCSSKYALVVSSTLGNRGLRVVKVKSTNEQKD